MSDDEHLAYGHDQGEDALEGAERGIVSDTIKKGNAGLSSLFNKLHGAIHDIGSELTGRASEQASSAAQTLGASQTRFSSFAGLREGNDVKWYVDGASYMWAVSMAFESARESIWILDWWLSPELYLRRPPAENEQYRVDHMLQAAAQRGVKVNIVVYKEVSQALTRKYLTPTLSSYLRSLLPTGTDPITSTLVKVGLDMTFRSLECIENESPLIAAPVTVNSNHTKHALENLHQNIAVFRHPDHLPDAQTLQSSFISSLQNLSLNAATASKLPGDALKALYGMNEDVILYWAHHEKLCIIDRSTAFMGGLDLCYGRWDTNQHSIADAHPGDLNDIVFPGQDFNNARIMDFSDVPNWKNNKLDRKDSSRMGWSDLSISLHGAAVEDLKAHFVQRWNFIYDEKYNVRKDIRYSRLTTGRLKQSSLSEAAPSHGSQHYQGSQDYGQHQQYGSQPEYPGKQGMYSRQQYGGNDQQEYSTNHPQEQGNFHYQSPYSSNRDLDEGSSQQGGERGFHASPWEKYRRIRQFEDEGEAWKDRLQEGFHHIQQEYLIGPATASPHHAPRSMSCQIVRSASEWSHGIDTEHSIANAYIGVIQNSHHFVYIENQFFITATSDRQKPVKNMIGAAIVERILRAARSGQKYHVIVVMPAIPAFSGDLKDESSLGTRAIMEYQYNSINRGGYSIMEEIAKAGFNPMEYIRFYNLRNYDRINVSASMKEAEQASGVDYEVARREFDDRVDPAGYRASGEDQAQYYGESPGNDDFTRYQQAASQINNRAGLGTGRWDSVAECYMLGGRDIRTVPWEGGDVPEIDAYVTEELYVHSKILIADDRTVICGSANLNDRSQLGYHDSEIAIIVQDSETVDSYMNGQPWVCSKFGATLRRQLFRKHLGLLPPQDMRRPDQNFEPVGVPNHYDLGSIEDQMVTDPLSDDFLNLWNSRAKQNTDAFRRIFHPVPDDTVRTWKDYDKFYGKFFHGAAAEAEGKKGDRIPSKYKWGHVVKEDFAPGDEGLREVKDILSEIKGTIVEMPLLFLIDEDIAKEGLSLNILTEEIYT